MLNAAASTASNIASRTSIRRSRAVNGLSSSSRDMSGCRPACAGEEQGVDLEVIRQRRVRDRLAVKRGDEAERLQLVEPGHDLLPGVRAQDSADALRSRVAFHHLQDGAIPPGHRPFGAHGEDPGIGEAVGTRRSDFHGGSLRPVRVRGAGRFPAFTSSCRLAAPRKGTRERQGDRGLSDKIPATLGPLQSEPGGRSDLSVDADTTLSADWSIDGPALVENGPLEVDEADLVRWLSAQFQTYPGCAAVSVEQVIRLSAPDSHGCNWSRTLFLDSGGVSPLDYGPAYAAIVDMARKAFNLKPPQGTEATSP